MNNDLISRSALKEKLEFQYLFYKSSIDDVDRGRKYAYEIAIDYVDNAPTVEYTFEEAFQKTVCDNKLYCPARPQAECRTCRHRDPEDKKCECGGIERQGCLFPVSDDYYCKFYEKGSEE